MRLHSEAATLTLTLNLNLTLNLTLTRRMLAPATQENPIFMHLTTTGM